MECTVCEPWQEECHLQGGHYFHAQDPIPASCHQHSLYYRKLNRKKKRQITECYLLLLLFHGFKDYQERLYEVSARKAVCYHLDTVYEIENIDIRSGGGKKCRKWLQHCKREARNLNICVCPAYKPHFCERGHSS